MKKYFSRVFVSSILLFNYGCSNDKDASTPGNSSSTNEDSTNIKIVLRLFDHFNEHDWSSYASLYADSAKFLDPSFGKNEIIQSKEQTIKKYSDLQKAIPDIRDSLTSVNHTGQNVVVVEFISTGILPDRSKLYLPICTVFKIKDGKIIEDHTYFDN